MSLLKNLFLSIEASSHDFGVDLLSGSVEDDSLPVEVVGELHFLYSSIEHESIVVELLDSSIGCQVRG